MQALPGVPPFIDHPAVGSGLQNKQAERHPSITFSSRLEMSPQHVEQLLPTRNQDVEAYICATLCSAVSSIMRVHKCHALKYKILLQENRTAWTLFQCVTGFDVNRETPPLPFIWVWYKRSCMVMPPKTDICSIRVKLHIYIHGTILFQDFFASGMAFFLIGAGSTSSALLKLYMVPSRASYLLFCCLSTSICFRLRRRVHPPSALLYKTAVSLSLNLV